MLNYTHIRGQFKINQKDMNLTTIIPWAVRLSWLAIPIHAQCFQRTILTELVMNVKVRHQWRRIVHDAGNPHSEDG